MIYDSKTSNKSFIKMYKILKKLGIRNNKFFLVLYDKQLQGVNPRDELNLTNIQKERIKIEVKRNPWYFIREVVRLSVAGGIKQFELHRGNLAMYYCMLNCLNFICMLPRQNYKTISVLVMYVWIYYFGTINSNMIFVNKELSDSKKNLKLFKDIYNLLPNYLKYNNNPNDKDNIEYIESVSTGNTIKVIGSAITKAEADKKGRGLTVPLTMWDEFAFLKYNDTMYLSAAPATSQAKIEAKNNKKFYGTSIITTPNSIDLPEGRFCKDTVIAGSCVFDEIMYDWSKDEVDDCIQKKSDNNFLYIEYSYKQLGHNKEWFEQQKRDLLNDYLKIRRELLLEWTRSSDTSVFSEEQLAAIERHLKKVVFKININRYFFIEMYYPQEQINFDKVYIISCDTAGGLENDACALTIFDPITFDIIGEFRENKIDTFDFEKLLESLVMEYFPNAVLVLERNNTGIAIIDTLMRSPVARRVYYEYNIRMASKIENSMTTLTYANKKVKKQEGGVATTVKSRPLMLEILNWMVNNEPELIATKNIYSDIKNLERKKNGKVEHREGAHDDSLFSYLVGRYCLAYGKNLAKFMLPLKPGESYSDHTTKMRRISREISLSNNTPDELKSKFAFSPIAMDILNEYEQIKKIEMEKEENKEKNKKIRLFNKIIMG